MWGIGSHTAAKLNYMGIYTVKELAHADVKELKKKFGIMGEQLYYHAWGIDYSEIEKKNTSLALITKVTVTHRF